MEGERSTVRFSALLELVRLDKSGRNNATTQQENAHDERCANEKLSRVFDPLTKISFNQRHDRNTRLKAGKPQRKLRKNQ